jgi:hypothetical protein
MTDLGAIGVRVDEVRAWAGAGSRPPYDLGAWAWRCERAMTVPWVPRAAEQAWGLVVERIVLPWLLAPFHWDNRAEEQVPWRSLAYGESWFSRPRPPRAPTYTQSLEQGVRLPGYPEDLVPVTGRVAHPDPGQVGVCLYGWGSRLVYGRVRPDETGAWRAEVPPGRYGISYQADGAQPVTHGPYQF